MDSCRTGATLYLLGPLTDAGTCHYSCPMTRRNPASCHEIIPVLRTDDRREAHRVAVKISRARYAALRRAHRLIATDIAKLNQEQVRRVVNRALRNVKAWEDAGIASPYYGKAWRRILQDPADRIPKMLRGHNANALVQNSPFGFILRTAKYRGELQVKCNCGPASTGAVLN